MAKMATMITSPSSAPPQLDASSPPTQLSKRSSLAAPTAPRRQSYGKNRMSTHSVGSMNRSRPASHAFPYFPSSLPYALVRDFAYPPTHPLHYGAPPKDSSVTTPVSESRRLSDPPSSWDAVRSTWPAPHWNPEAMYGQQQLPALAFGDGPPYSEDEDLHSPIVTTSKHRKHKSDSRRTRSPARGYMGPNSGQESDRGVFIGVNGDGSETYYVRGDDSAEDGPGGEYVTYPADGGSQSYLSAGSYAHGMQSNSHFTTSVQGQPHGGDFELESDDDISDDEWRDPSRYSRDYQFTIVSPDEEMHGKAVALFDFTREHENELPLKEGQVILVSYRHGQGWLVAEDPRTGESGLVPEEFVRLVRDIEGGLNSLNGALNTSLDSPSADAMELETSQAEPILSGTPANTDAVATLNGDTEAESANATTAGSPDQESPEGFNTDKPKSKDKEKHPPVVSTFSTSSRDLAPYPSHLLSGHQHSRSTPPQIEHFNTDINEPKKQSRRSKSISKQG
ncbi:SH3 domain-containing protein [Coccidioides immitis RS]|uniref:SH3 domain-containing protein n=3 Tax=Coccidioides immitis TaxID=5501 RepID=J3KDL3_COCIM|nr:SH3 domain-containing protein [Coccidioides immitis RS]EAS33469.3 SH3 domain-containing protein [Coccidioides immitis RS]KMU80136.1 NBP2 protein [Coccidioides immitis RMSCC 3703]